MKNTQTQKTIARRMTMLACAALVGTALVGGAAAAAQAQQTPATSPARIINARLKPGTERDNATRILADLTDFKPRAVKLDKYGGDTGVKLKATGFFRTQKVGDRWWMVTPDGHRYYNNAVNSVNGKPGSSTVESAYQSMFGGDENQWARQTVKLLRDSGFNATGSWSNDAALSTVEQRLPYASMLSFMSSFAATRGATQGSGHTNYPNDCIPVFDAAFPAHCDARAAEMVAKRRDDPYLVGYFSDNELPIKLDWLDKYLTQPETDPGRVAAEAFIKGRGLTAATLDEAARDAWIGVVSEKYFATVAAAMKKHDPNHLYLGCRFHGVAHRSDALFKAAGNHIDVISYNMYGVWTPSTERLARWTRLSGKPIAITEWYAKGDDSGLPNLSGAGWTVKTQEQRGMFYQNFVMGLIESPNVVGFHWFKYIDNDPENLKTDPSNRDSNKGMVTRDYKPYPPLVNAMTQLNQVVYPLADYFDAKRK